MHIVISTNLSPKSKTLVLADYALKRFEERNEDCRLIDLAETELPFCDGKICYQNATVQELTQIFSEANSLIIVSPIYNYDLNAAAKNLLELTGQGWNEKVIGFICNAGGEKSYMSVMPFANSLMLDHRCHIIPRFVYAAGNAFEGNEIVDINIKSRIEELVENIVEWA